MGGENYVAIALSGRLNSVLKILFVWIHESGYEDEFYPHFLSFCWGPDITFFKSGSLIMVQNLWKYTLNWI